MSEDRGDNWTAISGDLTKNEERMTMPIMGKVQSWDSPWDIGAMSTYNTITSLSESPKKKGLIYAGTDDGLLQVTDNGGQAWRKINVSSMGVPSTSFINDVKADLFDEGTVYVSLDNHKYGDYKSYLVKSTDKGATWTRITNGFGDNNMIWRLVQDHVNKNLLFTGTEKGVFFSIDGGKAWTELKGGIPPISIRDLAIQKRENDLVAASFGRGFFIMDDYSALRDVSSDQMAKEATLFEPRDAWRYVPRSVVSFDNTRGSQGSQLHVAPNPDFGAVFTYYLKDEYKSDAKTRSEREKKLKGNIPFPGWEALEKEGREDGPYVYLEIKDTGGNVTKRVLADNKKGFNRVVWNLSVSSPGAMSLNGGNGDSDGLLVAPGTYSTTLYKYVKGKISILSEAVNVKVSPLYEGALEGASDEVATAFWREYEQVGRDVSRLQTQLSNSYKTSDKLIIAASRTDVGNDVIEQAAKLKMDIEKMQTELGGNAEKNEIGERSKPTIGDRMFALYKGLAWSTYGPTGTHKETMRIIKKQVAEMNAGLTTTSSEISAIAKQIVDAGGPWIEGQD